MTAMVKPSYRTASLLLGCVPVAALVHFYALFAHATIILGRFPRFGEAPETLAFRFHAFTVVFGLYFLAPVIVLGVPFAFWWLHRQGTRIRTGLVLFLLSGLFTYLMVRLDLANSYNWFRD